MAKLSHVGHRLTTTMYSNVIPLTPARECTGIEVTQSLLDDVKPFCFSSSLWFMHALHVSEGMLEINSQPSVLQLAFAILHAEKVCVWYLNTLYLMRCLSSAYCSFFILDSGSCITWLIGPFKTSKCHIRMTL